MPVQFFHTFQEVLPGFTAFVAVGFFGVKEVALHGPAMAAEFAEDQRLLFRLQALPGAKVDVAAVHIGALSPEPSGGGVNKPGRIQLLEDGVDIVAVRLAPALVENGPVADTGVVFQLVDHGLHGREECFPGFGVPVKVFVVHLLNAYRGQCRIPEEIVVAVVDHILKYDHTQLVAQIVKFLRLCLDVLTQGVEAKALHGLNIPAAAIRGGRGVDTVTPVALIQKSVEEIGAAIEAQPGDIVKDLYLQSTQGKITLQAVLTGFHRKIIKLRILRRPGLGVFRGDDRCAFPQGIGPALTGDGAI